MILNYDQASNIFRTCWGVTTDNDFPHRYSNHEHSSFLIGHFMNYDTLAVNHQLCLYNSMFFLLFA